ncbi:hypothetical protein CANTEDRAFT_123190 [Yamadazyma tenuis ATCC 10573]|uniref:Protein CSF1 n=1 Tax=Candida tenuis (strain ATCC 10573 / BCRC 21748 / CBS 615 / JCM 9827 / NBRC 10315 / NRRL Y-1498 / VKM Y-70) TaxID=590646 RepID=G3B5H9_CANTC|nr:uncharacterized protein CANTEDRAFT_123190 [Yamadazyma tenuis ATCC 10573]EGV63232.1 hypothetical protein CANTEDRAFT_123190 [Yamadazyma tenuis ATCC 10573]
MAVQSQFIQVASHSTDSASSWIYLVDWILVLILGIAFVFYFGRFLGFILSTMMRFALWRTSGIMINIESIRFSPLGGRLMIKNLTIGTENQTVSVLRVNLTCRYWLWGSTRLAEYVVQEKDETSSTGSDDLKSENDRLSTRFLLSLEGLEIFMYNRTFAYDNIMKILTKDDPNMDSTPEKLDDHEKDISDLRQRSNRSNNSVRDSTSKSDESTIHHSEVDMDKLNHHLSRLLSVFPISVSIKRAVLVLGNHSTPSLLIHSCKSANGIADIRRTDSKLDICKHLYFFKMEKFQILMKANILYDESSQGNQPNKQNGNTHAASVSKFKKLQRTLNVVPSIFASFSHEKASPQVDYQNWIGLRRYLNASLDDFNYLYDNLMNSNEEYGKYSLILDSVSTQFSYYYDIPGKVDAKELNTFPEFGADIRFSMATIHYGPWADKQRVPIQQAFFPPISRDTIPSPKPQPGQLRQYQGFKVNVVAEDEIIFRIPTREPSKDKEALKTARTANNINKPIRPFGWLELKMGANSSISSFSSFLCSEEEGFPNTLFAVFLQPELSTSVNHDILYLADVHTLDAKFSFPLEWNGPCEWVFDNSSSNARIFFLREHTLLISDMFADFGSGAPAPYENFRPFTYLFNWNLQNYRLYLNINDSNIINNPLDFDSNKYLSVQGKELELALEIPLLTQVTRLTSISFKVFAPYFDLNLDVPPWHTMNSFNKPSVLIGRANNFTIDGSYSYLSTVEINTHNTIVIRSKGDDVMVKFYGILMKYIFIIRENYLGDSFHFKTFEEYNNDHSMDSDIHTTSNTTLTEQFDYWKMVKTDNNVDVLFSFQVRNGLLVLPHEMYGTESHIALSFDYFDADIRFTNFYMDMQADFSPTYGMFVKLSKDVNSDDNLTDIKGYLQRFKVRENFDILIDEFSVHGHRMFGIPPKEVTYYCNWVVATNLISIDSDPSFLLYLVETLSTFMASFKDLENALHPTLPTIYDALCFSFQCPELNVKLSCGKEAVVLNLRPVVFTFNDIANSRYSAKLSVNIQEIEHKIVNEETKNISALFRTSLVIDNILRKPKYNEHRRLQQEHIRFNDAPFHRASQMLFEETKNANYYEAYRSIINPVSLPDVPLPLNRYTNDINNPTESLGSYSSSNSSLSEQELRGDRLFISPTLDYAEEDFQPDSQKDESFKYENLIYTFDDIIGFISPKAIEVYASFQDSMHNPDLNNLMDLFEKHVVDDLKLLMLQVSTNENQRLVAPSINISFGEFHGMNEVEISDALKYSSAINILVTEPSMALSMTEERRKLHSEEYLSTKQTSTAFSFKNIIVNITSPKDFDDSISLCVKDIEFWQADDKKEEISSLIVEDVSLDLGDAQLIWLIRYIDFLSRELQPSLDAFQKNSEIQGKSQAALVYTLGLASKKYKVDDDSTVLTKPAYVLRSLKEHIRVFDSWKVLVRLRHIFQSMDDQWVTDQENALRQNGWKIPSTAYEETWDVFSKWRSWESNFQERETFFQKIFNFLPVIQKSGIFQTTFHRIAIEFSNQYSKVPDYIEVQNAYLSFTTQKKDAIVRAFHILANIGSYKGAISPATLTVIPSLMEEAERFKPKRKASEQDVQTESAISVVFNINNFDQQLQLDYLCFQFQAFNLSATATCQAIEEDSSFMSFTAQASSILFQMKHDSQQLISHGLEEISVVSYGGNASTEMVVVDAFVENSYSKIIDDKLSHTIEMAIEMDMKYLELLKPRIDPTVTSKDDHEFDFHELLNKKDVIVNVQVNHFSYMISLLKTISLHGAVYDNSISLILSDGAADISSLLQKIDFNLKTPSYSILELEHSQMLNNIKICEQNGTPAVSVDSQLGFSKIFCPKLIRSINEILDNFQDSVLEYESVTPLRTSESKFNLGEIPIDVKFATDYVGMSFLADRSRYSMESENIEIKLSNIITPEVGISRTVSYYGSVSVPSFRISIADRIIPVGLSNIIDVNILIKLINEKKHNNRQILEVVSHYCRVCLSFGAIQRIVFLADELAIIKKELEKQLKQSRNKKTAINETKESFLSFISGFHILSYNFCIGWIFEDARNDYPGLILGAERFYAVTDEGIGKLSLMEAYLAVAHGSTSSGFFSTQSEKTNSNRAFLPFVQFVYVVTDELEGKRMKSNITGDELDVNYLSNSFHIFEYVIKSGSQVQAFFDKRVKIMDKWKDDSKSHEEQQVDYMNSLRSTFSSIECKATFAGSIVSLQKIGESGDGSSFILNFPAVKSTTTYSHYKSGAKKHSIKSELFTSSSDNKIYASCVPVIMDIVYGVKRMVRLSNQNHASTSEKEVPNKRVETSAGQKNFSFSTILEETDIHFGIKVDKQKISLSCEPTAKVEAIVGIGGIYFQVNSGSNASINAIAVLDKISAAVQHVYSREVSGSIDVNSVVLTTSVELLNEISVKSASCISNVEGYVNVKQFQDLALFKDIWWPKHLMREYEEPQVEHFLPNSNELADNKNIAWRFKEVSTTNAIPWFITFVLSDVLVKVNCGPSLGEMMFKLNEIWAVSQKTPDWTQQFKMGINAFEITSEGRLGGDLIANDLYLHSEVTWKLDEGKVLDVPLILVSAGVDQLAVKSTFDYHVFVVISISDYSIDLYNQKSELMISKDHLFVAAQFKACEIYMSSFTASNVLDIYNAVLRMTQDNKISYKETLHDSNKNKSHSAKKSNKPYNNAILETVKKLETEFEVLAGTLLIHVYPTSFDDSKVLVIKLDESSAQFSQNEYNHGIANQLKIQFNDLKVSLSTNTAVSEDFIQEATVEDFSKYARKARGGSIFSFPSFQISMKTFQKYNTNLIEYFYQSTFGGTVDIRWNLGSVNFIREMYSIHINSLASRNQFRKTLQQNTGTEEVNFKKDIFTDKDDNRKTLALGLLMDPKASETSTERIDQALNEKIDKVSKSSKYLYLPLAPPIIEAPQLKELGNATPPLEWFGLHRNKLPNVTHEMGIVSLQKVIHQVESEYSRLLGRA